MVVWLFKRSDAIMLCRNSHG